MGGTALALVVLILGTAWLRPVRWENDLAALSPIPRALLSEDRRMRGHIGAPEVNHIAFISGDDPEAVLVNSEALAGELRGLAGRKVLSGFDMAALYLPSKKAQRERQARLPAPERVAAALRRAMAGLPFRPGLFSPFIKEYTAARTQAPLGPENVAGSALGLRVQSLLFQGHSRWVALVPLTGVRDEQALSAWFARKGDPQVFYLHLPTANSGLMKRFREEALVWVGLGMLMMIGVLLLELRNLPRLLRVFFPVALATVVELCLLVWFARPLTLFHLFSILLIFGIGIDYCIFLSQPENR